MTHGEWTVKLLRSLRRTSRALDTLLWIIGEGYVLRPAEKSEMEAALREAQLLLKNNSGGKSKS